MEFAERNSSPKRLPSAIRFIFGQQRGLDPRSNSLIGRRMLLATQTELFCSESHAGIESHYASDYLYELVRPVVASCLHS